MDGQNNMRKRGRAVSMATDVNKNIHAKVRTLFRTRAKLQSQMKLLSPNWLFCLISQLILELDQLGLPIFFMNFEFQDYQKVALLDFLESFILSRGSKRWKVSNGVVKEVLIGVVICYSNCLKMKVFMVYCMDSINLSYIVICDTVCKICDLKIFINSKTFMHNNGVFYRNSILLGIVGKGLVDCVSIMNVFSVAYIMFSV